MDTSTIVVTAAAILIGFLWLMKRRARLRSDRFE